MNTGLAQFRRRVDKKLVAQLQVTSQLVRQRIFAFTEGGSERKEGDRPIRAGGGG